MAYQQLTLDRVVIAATSFKGLEGGTVDREGSVYGGGTDGVTRKLFPIAKVGLGRKGHPLYDRR